MTYEGSKFDQTRGLGYSQIAALIRMDIKKAKSQGKLPVTAKYSVVTRTYAGGGSIDVTIRELPGAWIPQDDSKCNDIYCYNSRSSDGTITTREHVRGCAGASHLSDEAQDALRIVKDIWHAYNYNNSDPMVDYFDVHYYGTVEVETPWAAEWRAKDAATRATKRQAVHV